MGGFGSPFLYDLEIYMARPRKIKEELIETINDVPIAEVQDVIDRLNSSKPADAGFPVLVMDPRSRIVKRLWDGVDLAMHLRRGWVRNG